MFICAIFATKSLQRVCTERVASPLEAFLGAAGAPNFLVPPELRARADPLNPHGKPDKWNLWPWNLVWSPLRLASLGANNQDFRELPTNPTSRTPASL